MIRKTPVTRRQFLAATAVAGARMCWARSAPKQRPNILLIVSDQQHWRALGAVDPFFATPNLDRLARTGTRFSNAYCTTPICDFARPCRQEAM